MKENTEAIIENIRSMASKVKIAMMTTINDNGRMRSRPMQVMQVDEDAAMWFFTDEYAGKTETLKTDNPVVLTFSDISGNRYLSLSGRAYLIENDVMISSLWNPVLNTWFPGKSKEHLVMIKFVPEKAEYWSKTESLWKQFFYAGEAFATGDSYQKGKHEKVEPN